MGGKNREIALKVILINFLNLFQKKDYCLFVCLFVS